MAGLPEAAHSMVWKQRTRFVENKNKGFKM